MDERRRAAEAASSQALAQIRDLCETMEGTKSSNVDALLQRLLPEDLQVLWDEVAAPFLRGTSVESYRLEHNLAGKMKYLKRELTWRIELARLKQAQEEDVGSHLEVQLNALCDRRTVDLRWSNLSG